MAAAFAVTAGKYIAGTALTGSALVLGGLWWFQRSLIYPANFPQGSRTEVPTPAQLGMPYEDIYLSTPDGVKLHAYVIPARPTYHGPTGAELRGMSENERKQRFEHDVREWAEEMGKDDVLEYVKRRPTVVIFHANAGNMGHRVPLARKFNIEFKCNVFMLSYRGYGMSEGTPSEHGMRKDISAALEYVKSHPLLGNTKLIAFGQSIGGAASIFAASQHPDLVCGFMSNHLTLCKALILENTFLSLPLLIPSAMPYLPPILLPILLTEKWDNQTLLPLIPSETPILLLSGGKDELVPPSQMRALKEIRESGKKGKGTQVGDGEKKGIGKVRWREFPLGGHNDTCMIPDYWKEIGAFLKEELGIEF